MTRESNYGQIRWEPYLNSSGSTIPAYGCVRVSGVDSEGVMTGSTPSTSVAPALHGFNGPRAVADGAYGEMTFSLPALAIYASGTPAVGDKYKPTNSAFTLQENTLATHQWTVLGIVDASNKVIEVGPC